jgi:hypothetical protein
MAIIGCLEKSHAGLLNDHRNPAAPALSHRTRGNSKPLADRLHFQYLIYNSTFSNSSTQWQTIQFCCDNMLTHHTQYNIIIRQRDNRADQSAACTCFPQISILDRQTPLVAKVQTEAIEDRII